MVELWWKFRHSRLRRDLSAYIDGWLRASQARCLEAHLATCDQCRRELAELRAAVDALRRLPQVAVPRSFALSPQQTRWQAPTSPQWYRPLQMATVAVAAALALLLVVDLAPLPGPPAGEEERPAAVPAAAPAPAAKTAGTPADTPLAEPAGQLAQQGATPAAADVAPPTLDALAGEESRAREDLATPEARAEGGPKAAVTPEPSKGPSALRLAEIAVGIAAALLVGGWVAMARRRARL